MIARMMHLFLILSSFLWQATVAYYFLGKSMIPVPDRISYAEKASKPYHSQSVCLSSSSFTAPSVSNLLRENQQKVLVTTPIALANSGTHTPEEVKQNVKLGVLFLNLGGPESVQDVEGFLYNLFADPDIIRLPSFLSQLQKPLAYFIAKRRAPKSSEAYRSIGGGSPIVKYTREQALLVEQSLQQRGYTSTKCYFAMRYWHPFTEDVLQQMQRDGINTLVVVPLYPQFSISTSGSSLKLLQDLFYKQPEVWGPDKVVHTVVPAWYHRKGYIQAMAKLIVEQIQQYSFENMKEGIHVLYSAHGVPQSYIQAGDPYQQQIEECIKLISREVQRQLTTSSSSSAESTAASELSREVRFQLAGVKRGHSLLSSPSPADDSYQEIPSVKFHLSFQSRVGPVKWLQPYTEEKLIELGEQEGVKNLVVVPVSFVSEHIETLEEIDMEYKEVALEHGITNWRRVPALNTEPSFIEDLTELVIEALDAPALTVAEAASMSYSDMISSQTMTSPLLASNQNHNRVVDRELSRSRTTHKRKKVDDHDDRNSNSSGSNSNGGSGRNRKSTNSSNVVRGTKKPSIFRRVFSALPSLFQKLPFRKKSFDDTSRAAAETLFPILSDPSLESLPERAKSYGLWGSAVRRQEQQRQEAARKKRSSLAVMSVLSTSTVWELLSNLHLGAIHPVMNHLMGASK